MSADRGYLPTGIRQIGISLQLRFIQGRTVVKQCLGAFGETEPVVVGRAQVSGNIFCQAA